MDVSVVKTNDNFYNATKIVQDNGYHDFAQISRLKSWKSYYLLVKRIGKFDEKTNLILPSFESAAVLQPINDNELTDDELTFQIEKQS